ncbi:MAG: energy-coupling factor ABC transporter permease [Gammaproteobacteria bacterium]|jgi:cobalt/nickel transport system permease protein
MHIPDSMLLGSVCPVTAVVTAVGIAVAAYCGVRAARRPTAARFGAVTALIFAGQMLNFPIMDGTSGHLLGGVLAASLLGTPFGVLAIALVVALQSLVFSDGGITVLGANILNMAILGAGLGGMMRSLLAARWQGTRGGYMATAVAAWVAVILAAFAVSVELAIDGQIAFSRVVIAMVATHALIGVGEALITVAVCMLLATNVVSRRGSGQVAVPLLAAFLLALLLTPFASGFPDGLEWIAQQYGFLHQSAPAFVGPLSDYMVPWLDSDMFSTGLAGVAGVILSFGMAWSLSRLLGMFSTSEGAV